MADITETDRAYAAGLFDGEGCVQLYMKKSGTKANGQKDRSLTTALSVAGADLRPLEWLQERWQGALRVTTKNGPHSRRALGIWTVMSHQAEVFGRDITPHLIVKREQLDLWFQARAMMYSRGYAGIGGISEDEVSARRALVERVKNLKRVNLIA